METGIIVIFSGFNQRAVIAFLRTLKQNNISCAIIAKSQEDTIFETEYKEHVYLIRDKLELEIEDLLAIFDQIKKRSLKDNLFIAPSTEAMNRILLENKDILTQKGITLPLVEETLYKQVSDKYSFGQLCEEYGILIPLSKDQINDINIPFVAKPYTYFNKSKEVYVPQLIYTLKDKDIFKKRFSVEDYYYQEFISGRSFYLLYYFDKEGNVYKYSQENIAQQPEGKSIVAAIPSTIHDEEISDKFEYMLTSIAFRGLIMIEIKKEKNKYYMIEANPRFWGPSQLFVDSGINFFEFLLYDYEILHELPIWEKRTEAKYFWYGGMVEANNKNLPIVFHTKDYLINNKTLDEWLESDIYKRVDTIKIFEKEISKMTKKEELIALYANNSKHSNYQILSKRLSDIIGNKNIDVRTRYESERLNYILKNISIKNKSVLDIGGNSGFFSLELLEQGASHILFYEGNNAHANFVSLAADVLTVKEKIDVVNKYFSFENELEDSTCDITLLLNVLHHIGDDYGNSDISLLNAKLEIIKQLNSMANKTSLMVFQLGFNWKGNPNIGLFENGTKAELIDFIKENISSDWDILRIGIAVKNDNGIEYQDLNDENIKRDDSLGEFLNRPLFILKSKK